MKTLICPKCRYTIETDDTAVCPHCCIELKEALLGCPLCNGPSEVWCIEYGDCHIEYYYYVNCKDHDGCGCQTGEFKTPEEAIQKWHRNPANRTWYPIEKVNW